MKAGNETVKSVFVGDVEVDIVGCWDSETPENEFDFYDLYVDGECINLGEPCYTFPTDKDIQAFLSIRA